MSEPKYIDIHLLQTLPYSNVNRDDLGSPKSLVYGGVTRTRVSSQAWKRPVRLAVESALDDRAVRTRRVPGEVRDRLIERGWPEDLAVAGGAQLMISARDKGIKTEDNGGSSVLLYLPESALDELADLVEAHRDAVESQATKKPAKAALPAEAVEDLLSRRNGTINLFGRMLAELPSGGVDGAVQVAHAFTTHATEPEVDFFTAVDDLNPPEDRGSGHMSSAEFSAGVFYRFASLDVLGLIRNLGGDRQIARDLVQAFLMAFIGALPTAKQRSTAAQTLPDLAHIAVRSDRPVSFAPAFESPVRAENEGWAEPSVEALRRYAADVHRLWGDTNITWNGHAGVGGKPLTDLGDEVASYHELVAVAVAAAYSVDAK